jgi:dnaB-like helicase N terminal domain
MENAKKTFDNMVKMPPCDIQAEKALIGKLLVDQELVGESMEMLKPEYFYGPEHRTIFKAMQKLNAASEPIDIITVKNLLQSEGDLIKIGGLEYLTSLLENVTILTNGKEYIDIILEKYKLRTVIEAGNLLLNLGFSGSESTNSIIDQVEKKIYQLAMESEKRTYEKIDKVLVDTLNELNELYNRKSGITGLATGLVDFDRKTTGLKKSSLIILAARPRYGEICIST